MPFLSELIKKRVTDIDNQPVGQVKNLIASIKNGRIPEIVAIVINRAGHDVILPISSVAVLFAPAVPLNITVDKLPSHKVRPQDVFLYRDVLDKQVIDINGIVWSE